MVQWIKSVAWETMKPGIWEVPCPGGLSMTEFLIRGKFAHLKWQPANWWRMPDMKCIRYTAIRPCKLWPILCHQITLAILACSCKSFTVLGYHNIIFNMHKISLLPEYSETKVTFNLLLICTFVDFLTLTLWIVFPFFLSLSRFVAIIS